jgi:hypothetical protein
MTPAAEALLRVIVRTGCKFGMPETRVLADIAAQVLAFEGLPPEPVSPLSPVTSHPSHHGTGKGEGLSEDLQEDPDLKHKGPSLSGNARGDGVTSRDVTAVTWRTELRAIADALRDERHDSTGLHRRFVEELQSRGWETRIEVPIEDIGDGQRGCLDVLATKGEDTLAVELDRLTPRGKSVLKLQCFDTGTVRVSVLRCAPWSWAEDRPWADVVIGLGWPRDGEPLKAHRVTDDGCFGMAVQAWQEGIRSVTGLPYVISAGLYAVTDAIRLGEPDTSKRIDWARDKGAKWARVRIAEGRTLKAIDFPEWLSSGEPAASPYRNGQANGTGTYRVPIEEQSDAQVRAEVERALGVKLR